MTAATKLVILGCGGSAGTPAICNHWGKCDPDEPRNRRSRASAAIVSAQTSLLIDTGPEVREQVNRVNIKQIDAVLYTHAHGDHIHGIDDLRSWRNRSKALIDIWGNRATIEELQERFTYMFADRAGGLYPQVLRPNIYTLGQGLSIGDITLIPFDQDHGTCRSVGFRVGDTAYCTDVIGFDDEALTILKGIKNWVIDSAGYKMPENVVHMGLKDIYRYNETVGATNVWLTHLTPAMDYRTLLAELPPGYAPAYDGLEIEIGLYNQPE